MTPASTASLPADLGISGMVITYLDEDQGINFEDPLSFDSDPDTAECLWTSSWLIGSGDLIETAEQVELTVTLTNLTTLLNKARNLPFRLSATKAPL